MNLKEANQKIENKVVGSYKKIEENVVFKYNEIEDKFVGKFLTKKGETTEEAKARIRKELENK